MTITDEKKLKFKKVPRKYEVIGTTMDPEVNSRFSFNAWLTSSYVFLTTHHHRPSFSLRDFSINLFLYASSSSAKNLIYRLSLESITCLSLWTRETTFKLSIFAIFLLLSFLSSFFSSHRSWEFDAAHPCQTHFSFFLFGWLFMKFSFQPHYNPWKNVNRPLEHNSIRLHYIEFHLFSPYSIQFPRTY